ncbi:uncharacterized protein CG5098 isoform X2 [Hippocampus zosterae]|uniref:uncharacterized protein CG5098 isoform X2 n=1 Tax=Hippocampus zosterae TaxID=109293 RepID=UPI00223CC2D7|nr:uncharacterized protein CG5098 isoform X2 [Hippocampus zosterae]
MSAELFDNEDTSASFGTTTASQADKAGSFQSGSHNNGKLKTSVPHSQLQFQASALAPALALSPANAAEDASVADDSLFQKSHVEFLPLRASPDFSAAHESDEGSLSQHPLAQETSDGESALAPGDDVDAVAQAADVTHVTLGSRSTQPDAASELLYRKLLSQSNKSTPQTSKGGTSVPGSECDAAEQSYLGFLPHSRPASAAPTKSAVKSGRLSVIPSSYQNSQQVPFHADPSSDVSADSKMAASSSAVRLEVDNDAPYWTSQHTTSSKQVDLNIEDRIPLYLQNLGIDQSPADILTPFAPRGPIREPEFSPTDLSTVKDSAGGTPMKSIASSEAGSPPKVEPSDCNTLSAFGHRDPRPTVHDPRSEGPAGPGGAGSSAKLSVAPPVVRNRDTDRLRRAEPEGCSTAPRSPPAVGAPPTADDRDPASFASPAPHAAAGLGPLPEDPEDQASVSDGSAQSSLTVRVAELLRDGSPAAGVSDREDPKHKKRFVLELSEGRFDSLELDKEDRRRIEEIKAAMLSNNFVTSESSTDTESTAAASGVAAPATPPPLSAPASAWMPLLPEAEPARPEAALREIADVKAHTSITIAARKRPAAPCPPPPDSHPPAGIGADRTPSWPEEASADAMEAEASAEVEASAGPEELEGEASRRRHAAEDTTLPFGHVSRAHLTLSPKPPEQPPRPRPASSSSSSLSAGAPGDRFVPLRRSSPAVSSADEGVGLCGPPPKRDERRQPTSARPAPAPAPPPPHYLHQLSVAGNAMRSYTPETPVRDECVPRAAAAGLRPYKPRGANEVFFMPHVEADASSSCTTMESSHTGLDDAVPPLFSAEVLGRQDPGLDRGVAIKHAEGIYSKRRSHAPPLLLPDRRFPHAGQHEAPTMERLGAAGAAPQDGNRLPPGLASREAWLLEQLQRLSDLILTTGGADVPPSRTPYGESEPPKAWPRQAPAPCGLCPADRDESSTTTSTLDTDRLVRVFGAHRIQSAKTPQSFQKISKSSSRLHKLYDHVAKQREQWEGRGFDAALSETTATEASNVTGESSSTGSFAKTPQHTPSKKILSRGVQAGDVEFVCNATRLCTRDVGTMFPPPGRARRSAPKGHVTSLKHKKTRTPPSLPKAVWWFIPLDESSKENRPEEQDEPGEVEAAQPDPSTVWYDTAAKTPREPLRPRQQFDDDDDDVAHPGSSASCHQITSLQEALATRRPDFISLSRQRVQILSGRKINAALPGSGMPRRAVPRKEMKQRTKQLYEGLPEVLRKLEMERRDTQLRLNRLNLQIFNKKITKRRLENCKAVQYENFW